MYISTKPLPKPQIAANFNPKIGLSTDIAMTLRFFVIQINLFHYNFVWPKFKQMQDSFFWINPSIHSTVCHSHIKKIMIHKKPMLEGFFEIKKRFSRKDIKHVKYSYLKAINF